MKVCKCHPFSFDQAELRPAPGDWQAERAWYCLQCGLIHHAHQEVETVTRAPRKDTVGPISSHGLVNGQWITRWSTPDGKIETIDVRPYPRKVPMSSDEPVVYTVWQLLMSKVAIILREPDPTGDNSIQASEREQAQHQARGIAESLAILMSPFMEKGDDVVRHAVKKHKDPDHEVPGLAEYLWDPSKNYDGSDRVKVGLARPKAATRPKVAAKPPSAQVNNASTKEPDADEIAGMKFGLDSGMFTKEQVCSTFGISMATLERVLAVD